jgi:hypothetical protein
MGLTNKDIVYEQFFLGFKGMFHGLIFERDLSWMYYPFFIFIRILAYSSMITKKMRYRRRGMQV